MDKKEIIRKVLKDEPKGFREEFLNDPKKALERISGKSLEGYDVQINRVGEKVLIFSLPENLPPWLP